MLFFTILAWIVSVISLLLRTGDAMIPFLKPTKSSAPGGKIVVVTGASGLLGKELVTELQNRNYIVRQLTTGKPDVNRGIFKWSPGAPGKMTSSGTVSGDPGFIDEGALEVRTGLDHFQQALSFLLPATLCFENP